MAATPSHLLRVALLAAACLALAPASAEESTPDPIGAKLRNLKETTVGRWRWRVRVAGLDRAGYSGESIRPRWPLATDELLDHEGERLYRRLTFQGAAGAPARTTAVVADAGAEGGFLSIDPETPLPDAFAVPRAIVEAAMVAAADPGSVTGQLDSGLLLELDGLLAQHIARRALAGKLRVAFSGQRGRLVVERGHEGWRFTGEIRGRDELEKVDVRVEVELVVDSLHGILPSALAPRAAQLLQVPMPRPGEPRPADRVVDHYVREGDRLETTLWLWFSDRRGGLGGEGMLYDFQVKRMEWRDREGRPVVCQVRGPEPEPLQGGKLFFEFENLARRGIDRLELDLELSMNLTPVRVKAVWSRGGDLHEGEEAWLPAAPIEVEIGALPTGLEPLRER